MFSEINKDAICKKCSYCSINETVTQKEDCTVYNISDLTGDIVMTSYPVFDGVTLVYNDVNLQRCMTVNSCEKIIEINHCCEGRFECEFKNDFVYLEKGDMSIHLRSHAPKSSCFPTGHYKGISITIDPKKASKCISCMLEGVSVEINSLTDKFCSDSSGCFVMRSKPCLDHIFSELYCVPQSIRFGYYKIKVLEMLLFLSALEIDSDKEHDRHIEKAQARIAKAIGGYLIEHIDEHITINELAKIFGISQTLLKTCFKKVHGVSVYSFIRSHKMQSAAIMLKSTNKNILDIAGDVGYENGSKFAKAFRDVMGVAPKEYRIKNV